MPRLASTMVVAALAASLASCTAMHQVSATQNERLLKIAGFKVVAADTHVFSDPYECLSVGLEPQYERYRRLETEEMVPTVELVGIEAGPDWFDDMEAW